MIGRPKIAHRSLSVLALRTGTAEFESAGSDEWLLAYFLEKGFLHYCDLEALARSYSVRLTTKEGSAKEVARAEERVFSIQGSRSWKWVLNKGHSGLGNTSFERKDLSKQKVQNQRIGCKANASFERERCSAGASSRLSGATLRQFIDRSNAMFSGGAKH
ncbi:hypothetical protein TIFTF001_052231 [Ficus carica]|uniref:Uncharacterized protein n=1 Tax=Ficus carica TaxID=3494 RepID=A0AA88EI32_FICCA|nr:hypothetical protein TIFTF001_052231 [Ficus carica]